jgi:hypothetical protein
MTRLKSTTYYNETNAYCYSDTIDIKSLYAEEIVWKQIMQENYLSFATNHFKNFSFLLYIDQ